MAEKILDVAMESTSQEILGLLGLEENILSASVSHEEAVTNRELLNVTGKGKLLFAHIYDYLGFNAKAEFENTIKIIADGEIVLHASITSTGYPTVSGSPSAYGNVGFVAGNCVLNVTYHQKDSSYYSQRWVLKSLKNFIVGNGMVSLKKSTQLVEHTSDSAYGCCAWLVQKAGLVFNESLQIIYSGTKTPRGYCEYTLDE